MAAEVMVVEDDKDIRRNLKRLLESEGYVVSLAENGQVALVMLENTVTLPLLILLDLMMPVMDGFEFRERQQGIDRIAQIPVALMTAFGHIDGKTIKIRADATLKKPADASEILRVVGKFIPEFRAQFKKSDPPACRGPQSDESDSPEKMWHGESSDS